MKFSPRQIEALDKVEKWYANKHRKPFFYLAGYAGTGKTTLAKYLAELIGGKTTYMAFTGKAAQVMRQNGCSGARTIHSVIYKPDLEGQSESDLLSEDPDFNLNRESSLHESDLAIIDECSMVNEEIAKDIISFKVPILVLGDPAQLPPISGGGYFTSGTPDAFLDEVHRQAKDDPIIRLSMQVREGEPIMFGQYGETKVIPKEQIIRQEVLDADQILVGTNDTRIKYNNHYRRLNGNEGKPPQPGERIVCLRNNKEFGLLNGQLCRVVTEAKKVRFFQNDFYQMEILPDDSLAGVPFSVKCPCALFDGGKKPELSKAAWRLSNDFTYGYALTVHKSQGSQWDNVILFNEAKTFREHARAWLYTGITRAAKRITIIQ